MAASSSNFGFWRARRPLRAPDPLTRGRHRRMRTSAILNQPAELTVKLEVEKFKIYGSLRPTETHVHNSLPSFETIETEKTLMSFEDKRKTMPEDAPYGNFYRSLTSSVTPLASRMETTRSRVSSRGPETPKFTTFTLFPDLQNQGIVRPLPSMQSVMSRVVTNYELRNPYHKQPDRLSPEHVDRSPRSRLSDRFYAEDGHHSPQTGRLSSEDGGRSLLIARTQSGDFPYGAYSEPRSPRRMAVADSPSPPPRR